MIWVAVAGSDFYFNHALYIQEIMLNYYKQAGTHNTLSPEMLDYRATHVLTLVSDPHAWCPRDPAQVLWVCDRCCDTVWFLCVAGSECPCTTQSSTLKDHGV